MRKFVIFIQNIKSIDSLATTKVYNIRKKIIASSTLRSLKTFALMHLTLSSVNLQAPLQLGHFTNVAPYQIHSVSAGLWTATIAFIQQIIWTFFLTTTLPSNTRINSRYRESDWLRIVSLERCHNTMHNVFTFWGSFTIKTLSASAKIKSKDVVSRMTSTTASPASVKPSLP